MGQIEHRPKSKRINSDPLAKRHNRPHQNQVKQLITGTQPRKINRLNQATLPLLEKQFFWLPSLSFSSLLLLMNFLYKTALFWSDVGFYGYSFPIPFASPPSSSAWYLWSTANQATQLVHQRTRQNRVWLNRLKLTCSQNPSSPHSPKLGAHPNHLASHSLWEGWWVYTKLLADLIPWSFHISQTLFFLPCLHCFNFFNTFSHRICREQPNLLIFVSWVSVMSCFTWFRRSRICLFARGSGLILLLFGQCSIWPIGAQPLLSHL